MGGDDQVIYRQWKNEVKDMEDSNPHLFQTLEKLAHLLYYNGHWSDASIVYNRSLSLAQEQKGVDNAKALLILNRLINCAELLGKVNEANE